ncbi:MAG: histone deacetylase [Bacteroidota bacterium]
MATCLALSDHHHAHAAADHVERPARLDAVTAVLKAAPLWTQVQHLTPVAAPLEVARLVHTEAYVARLEDAATAAPLRLDPDTYMTPESLRVALEAVGGALAVTDRVLTGDATNGFVAVRPPGHHATPTQPMGFCLLSTVALAVRWAQQTHGLERAMVLDYDVHHGNGTQDVFYADPNVLVVNLHQHPLYPFSGTAEERGQGPGVGATLNVPLPAHQGDAVYLDVLRRQVAPAVEAFQPEVIFVSAGFDAHWRDPLGSMRLTTAGFAALITEALGWADRHCGGRLIGALEGGYDTEALACGVRSTVQRLLDPEAAVYDTVGPPPASGTASET